MSGSVIADNWSLQTIAEMMSNGLDEDTTNAISFDRTLGTHSYVPVPSAGIAFEALFDLLTDVVLRDQLLVDAKFTGTWTTIGGELGPLADRSVIRAVSFLDNPEKLDGPRVEFVNRLCATPSIRALHERNVQDWERSERTSDPMLSAALWGGAGMLARAFVYEKGYTPHPLRKRLIQQAKLALRPVDAATHLYSTMQAKRVTLNEYLQGGDTLYSLRLVLPPIPVLVIREAHDATQLVKIALQFRDQFQDLRNWLGEYQQAIGKGDLSARAPFEKILQSVSAFADRHIGMADSNALTFTAGIDALKVAVKGSPIEFVKNRLGIRANVNHLLLSSAGSEELSRLLGFFGHRHSALAIKVIEHFRS